MVDRTSLIELGPPLVDVALLHLIARHANLPHMSS
jgi:hypothetical protein